VEIVCLDLEGVLIPEIWITLAERTGIEALRATTREVPDYDTLMRRRLRIMDEHGLGLPDIQAASAAVGPLPGAKAFMDWLRRRFQVVILSDTFYEFAHPVMGQLGWPMLFCHTLRVNGDGRVVDYHLRMQGHKEQAVAALRGLNFKVFAAGDSYNDAKMLREADAGFFFRPPGNVVRDFPDFPVAHDYGQLQDRLRAASGRQMD